MEMYGAEEEQVCQGGCLQGTPVLMTDLDTCWLEQRQACLLHRVVERYVCWTSRAVTSPSGVERPTSLLYDAIMWERPESSRSGMITVGVIQTGCWKRSGCESRVAMNGCLFYVAGAFWGHAGAGRDSQRHCAKRCRAWLQCVLTSFAWVHDAQALHWDFRRWFSTTREDGRICRFLYPGNKHGPVTYRVRQPECLLMVT